MARHVCPLWVGYLLSSPLRKLVQNPAKILGPHVKPGMTVLDLGPAMGYFSLPMAGMVAPGGKVVCVDLQPKMLEALARRAAKAGLSKQIETVTCTTESLCLTERAESIDFALVFAVLHEIGDQKQCLSELLAALKPGALVLLAEPRNHVRQQDFDASIGLAQQVGFAVVKPLSIRASRAALLTRPAQPAEAPGR